MHYPTTFATCQVINVSFLVVALRPVCRYTVCKTELRQETIMLKHQKNKYKCLGLNVAYYRKQRGMSQMQLAELVNISRTHISRIETADCAVSLDVIFDICDALGVRPSSLFDFRED